MDMVVAYKRRGKGAETESWNGFFSLGVKRDTIFLFFMFCFIADGIIFVRPMILWQMMMIKLKKGPTG